MHIEAEGLGRRFGRMHAPRDLTFSSRPGEIVTLIGNNGAGKIALFQLLCGLLVPTAGTIRFEGRELDRRDETLRRSMAIVPDFPRSFTPTGSFSTSPWSADCTTSRKKDSKRGPSR